MKNLINWLIKNRRLILFVFRVAYKAINRALKENRKEFEKLEKEKEESL